MSCEVGVVVVGGNATPGSPTAAASALDRLGDLERRWSRFRCDSEISRLNMADGRPCRVGQDTMALVVALVEAWHVTRGAFDPTLLVPLAGLGYLASRDDARHRTSLPAGAGHRGRPDCVLVDNEQSVVQLPPGTVLDPGGLGKGVAADLVVAELLDAGAAGALVEVGGDVRIAGQSPDGHQWPIAIDHGVGHGPVLIEITAGGVATSSTRRRTWRHDNRTVHHLLDPATLEPTAGEVVAATVVARSAQWAEALTKPAFVERPEDALALYDELGVAGCLTTADGARRQTANWREVPSAVVGAFDE